MKQGLLERTKIVKELKESSDELIINIIVGPTRNKDNDETKRRRKGWRGGTHT